MGKNKEMNQPESGISLEEIYDKLAKEKGYKNWKQLRLDAMSGRLAEITVMEILGRKAAELYASQLSPDADRYKKLEEAFEELLKEYREYIGFGDKIEKDIFNEFWRAKAQLTIKKAE